MSAINEISERRLVPWVTRRRAADPLAIRPRSARVQFLALASAFGVALAAFLLALAYSKLCSVSSVDPTILLPRHRIGLRPKPVERFAFVSLGFAVPLITYAAFVFVRNTPDKPCTRFTTLANGLLPLVLALALIVPFFGFSFGESLLTGRYGLDEHPLRYMVASVTVAVGWCAYVSWYRRGRSTRSFWGRVVVWTIFLTAIGLQALSWRLVGEASITPAATWWNSADAVIYSVSQVVGGRTILADLPSQYGLFAEILAPVFKLIGLSILSFTAVCLALQLLALCGLFYVLDRLVSDVVVKAIAGIAFAMVTFETSLWLIGIDERYFQYWPIRFFWPAMSILAFFCYSRSNTLARATAVAVIAAVGSLWNADSGLMIEVSLAAFFVGKWGFFRLRYPESYERERKHLMLSLSVQVCVFVAIVCGLFCYMALKADRSLHFSWLYEYQKLFYGTGFMMLPMPITPSPWMSVLAVYLIGMMTALSSWTRTPRARNADLVFFISFLGLGLFVYYEGRSHILNLITVLWPALLLTALGADRVLRFVRAGALPMGHSWLAVVSLALMMYCAIPFGKNVAPFWRSTVANFNSRGVPESALVADELSFIRKNSHRDERCLILARRQGLYYAATGSVSPFVGPGYAELLTVRERDELLRQLAMQRFACVILGMGDASTSELGVDLRDFLKGYDVVSESSMRTLQLLRPRPASRERSLGR